MRQCEQFEIQQLIPTLADWIVPCCCRDFILDCYLFVDACSSEIVLIDIIAPYYISPELATVGHKQHLLERAQSIATVGKGHTQKLELPLTMQHWYLLSTSMH